MLKRFYGRAAAKDDEAKKDGGDGDAGGFPAVENVFLIFGGPTINMSSLQRKWERHEVLAAEKAPPSFLYWSEDAITFSHEDHPNHIPNPGQCPLVVNPVIGNVRFSKVLMDGGSSLNILYAHTLRLLGIELDQLRPSTTPFHGVAPGKRVQPLGQIDLPVWFGTLDNYRKETLTFEVVGFRGAYHAILGWPCYAKFMAVPNYTPQDEDAGAQRRHHHGLIHRAHLRLRRRVRGARRGPSAGRSAGGQHGEDGQRGPQLHRQTCRQLRGC
jgi:hypothetical protein